MSLKSSGAARDDAGKLTELAAEVTGQVARAGQAIAGWRQQLREADEKIKLARIIGASDTELLPILLTHGWITRQIDGLAEKKRAAEEWLAAVASQPHRQEDSP